MKGLMLLVFGIALGASVQGQLRINEFMAVNESVLADGCGSFDDWIEIYNAGDSAVCLNGFFLSDDPAQPRKFRIQASKKQSMIVPAHGYLLIWCDEDELEGPTHANFRLSAAGEFVSLSTAQGNLVDSVSFGPQSLDESFGRCLENADIWEQQSFPSPCEGNVVLGGHSAMFSVPSRLMDAPCWD